MTVEWWCFCEGRRKKLSRRKMKIGWRQTLFSWTNVSETYTDSIQCWQSSDCDIKPKTWWGWEEIVASLTWYCRRRYYRFSGCLSAVLVHLFVRTDLVTTISHEGLITLDETYREYLLAPTDDLIRFWRSKVRVAAGHRGGEGPKASMSMLARVPILVNWVPWL